MSLGYTISFDKENGFSISEIPKTVREYKGKSLLDFKDDYVVLDLETTGLDPQFDEIIEMAAMKFVNSRNGKLLESTKWYNFFICCR